MSGVKGYTSSEVSQEMMKNNLLSDYGSCKRNLKEIKEHEEEIRNIRAIYDKKIVRYRIDSVSRVLDFIRSEYRAGRICDLEILLCHCQNKLNGNIDGTELNLDEHLKGVPFKKVRKSNADTDN